MKILQIGSGFIGEKVTEKLKEQGHEVKVADVNPDVGADYVFSITDAAETDKVIAEEWDVILLIAAIANLNQFEKNPRIGMSVNVEGLINVCESVRKHGGKLVFISTCCVYGNTPDLPSHEESYTDPSEIYACAKLAGEWIIKGYNKSYDLEYLILRIATCYGPGMRAALAPAVFINQALSGGPITIHGDGKQTRTLTYIDDEVDGITTAISSGAVNETFNISSEEETSVNDLAEIIREETGKQVAIVHIKDRKGQTFREAIDAGKIREVRLWKGRYAPSAKKVNGRTGWQAKVSLREGIKRTLEWMRKNDMEKIE